MICLSSNAISILDNDGLKKTFDPEEIQAKLIKACISAGLKDYWLAEDITNAVENALTDQAKNGNYFSEPEINSFIIKILNNAGFSDVAENFKNNNTFINDKIKIEKNSIEKVLSTHLGLNKENLKVVTNKVIESCKILNLQEAASNLILELGRHYNNNNLTISKLNNLNINKKTNSSWLMTEQEVLANISDKSRDMFRKEIISIRGISSIFMSLNINIKLTKLAEQFDLDPILTELVILPYFQYPASSINEVIQNVFSLLKNKDILKDTNHLPVYLRFPDLYNFAEQYFSVSLPNGNKFCKDLAKSFANNINHPVHIKGLR